MLIGITLDALLTLILLPPIAIAIFYGLWWWVYFPKNAKTIYWAKVFRQDVYVAASDSGNGRGAGNERNDGPGAES